MKRLMPGHVFKAVTRVIFRIGEHNLRSRRAVEKIGTVLLQRVQRVTVQGRPGKNVYCEISRVTFDAAALGP
jgi:hypothetical protein